MKLIQYYKLIILVLLSCLFAETLKPSNSRKLEKVKISTKDDSANIADRVDPDVLKAFKENPYTQSLSSA